MNTTRQALYGFFGSFGIPAFLTNNIPDGQQMPYITFDLIEPVQLESAYFNASVWYRDTSTKAVSQKADEIRRAIGRGLSLPVEGGVIYIFQNTPFCQLQNDPNPETKRAYLSMKIQCNID